MAAAFRWTRPCLLGWILLACLQHSAHGQSWLAKTLQAVAAPPAPSPAAAPQPATPHPAVVRIIAKEANGMALGSGTLVDVQPRHGLVLTNWHVVRDATHGIEVQFPNGFVSPGHLHKVDKDWDLAALAIYRPQATPVQLAQQIPQPGQRLLIAGYGSGDFRQVAGVCSQFLAPSPQHPYEIIEVAEAAARQGDSGGPILDANGNLAGVLFGQGGGNTCGSHCGRVKAFLQDVLPANGAGSRELASLSGQDQRSIENAALAARTGRIPIRSLGPHSSDPLAYDANGVTQMEPIPAADDQRPRPELPREAALSQSEQDEATGETSAADPFAGFTSARTSGPLEASTNAKTDVNGPLPAAAESYAAPSVRTAPPIQPETLHAPTPVVYQTNQTSTATSSQDWLRGWGLRVGVVFGILVSGKLLLSLVKS